MTDEDTRDTTPPLERDDVRLKIQALIDNELDESEIEPLLKKIESSYEYRREYVELKRLAARLKGLQAPPEPPREWFETTRRKLSRRLWAAVGKVLFLGSYLLLVGYALYLLITDPTTALAWKIIIAGIAAGFLLLLGITIADRIVESRTDRYKEVMK